MTDKPSARIYLRERPILRMKWRAEVLSSTGRLVYDEDFFTRWGARRWARRRIKYLTRVEVSDVEVIR